MNSNYTNSTFITLPFPIWETVLTIVALIGVILLTLSGNILVILSVFTHRPLRNVQNFLLVSLAVSDLAVAVTVMPLNVVNYLAGRWVFGAILCDIWLTSDILFCTASILNLCAIALDRYWAIRCPISYANRRTLKMVMFIILMVFALSALISIPPLFGWETPHLDPTVCRLTDKLSYVIFSASGSFFIPAIVMTVVYAHVFLAIQRRLRERKHKSALYKMANANWTLLPAGGVTLAMQVRTQQRRQKVDNEDEEESSGGRDQTPTEPEFSSPQVVHRLKSSSQRLATKNSKHAINGCQKISLYRERRAARTLGIVMGSFVLCWLPFFLMYVTVPLCGAPCRQNWNDRLENFVVWLGYVNSTLNPIIYTVFNKDFRRAFKKLLHLSK